MKRDVLSPSDGASASVTFRIVIAALAAALLVLAGTPLQANEPKAPKTMKQDVTWYGYEIVNRFPHDPAAFTQGLVWHAGRLYEGTGLEGSSSLRRVKLETGEAEKKIALAPEDFGEGIVIWGDSIIQLTWRDGVAFVYDLATFRRRRTFAYEGEGWGITHDGRQLIMSDGSSTLTFRDPKTFRETGRIDIVFRGRQLRGLNELEFINGEVWANVWTTNQIARINLSTGNVTGIIDLTGILSPADQRGTPVDVLNGIAYDGENDRIFVTGKNWPILFEIRLVPK